MLNQTLNKLANVTSRRGNKIYSKENDENENNDNSDDDSDASSEENEKQQSAAKFMHLNEIYSKVHAFIFPGLPEHYPLKKKRKIDL